MVTKPSLLTSPGPPGGAANAVDKRAVVTVIGVVAQRVVGERPVVAGAVKGRAARVGVPLRGVDAPVPARV